MDKEKDEAPMKKKMAKRDMAEESEMKMKKEEASFDDDMEICKSYIQRSCVCSHFDS
jgi:hypothetical protein